MNEAMAPTWDQHLPASLEAARTPALTGLFRTVSFFGARPPVSGALIRMPASYSFPSGHAFVSLVLCGLLMFIGFPSDVLGSWCLGGAWLALCLGVFSIWRTRPAHPHTMSVAGPRVNDPPTATKGEAQ